MSRRDQSEFESLAPEVDRHFAAAMREVYADYYAASNNRYMPQPRGVAPLGSGADYHYRAEADYFRMVERSRHFDRDNMVVGQGVNRVVDNIVQDGFTHDPNTGDEELDKEMAARWKEWADDPEACDYEGEKCFAEIEQLALRNVLVDGDLVNLPTNTGKLQCVENHRLRNPFGADLERIVHGVELDASRRRVAYWLTPEDINPLYQVRRDTKVVRYPTRDAAGRRTLWHLYAPRRMSQTRGVTVFAPSVVPISYHDDLQFANLVKAKVASFYAIIRERPDSEIGTPPRDRRTGARSTETQADGSTRTIEAASPGATLLGDPGEKITGFSPNIPNPEFFDHAHLILTFISVNLGLPLAVLLLDPSETNFSGWRGAIDQARMGFRKIQHWLRAKLHSPVYRWKVEQWIAADPILARQAQRSDVNVFGHKWHPPVWQYIEPAKDAASDQIRITGNLTSQRRRAHERGLDWDDLAGEIIDDRKKLVKLAIEAADELNAEHPEAEVEWRELAYGHNPGGIGVTFSEQLGDVTGQQTKPAPEKVPA